MRARFGPRVSWPWHNVPIMVGATDSTAPGREPRRLVGVVSASALADHRLLFDALEAAFPVSFQARGQMAEVAGLDGLIVLDPASVSTAMSGGEHEVGDRCPRLIACACPQGLAPRGREIAFGHDGSIARALRGRTLDEQTAPSCSQGAPAQGDAVLATALAAQPVWWHRRDASWTCFCCYWPQELAAKDALRDRLKPGHFMGMVALLHFLWHVCGDRGWDERPLYASFVIDDPNLHWTSYGYLDYAQLVGDATRHGYHVAFAMVPLDGWLANRRAVSLVKDNPQAISLLMHGNDHVADELGRLTDARRAEIVLAQALRRTASFQRRTGVTVERVMVPPHEACSMTALKAMSRLGFDAACIGRRHPWLEHEPLPADARWPLIKWNPADLVGGGLPIIPRYLIDRPREDLVMRALLGQPLVLFGHHWDCARGLGVLSDAADYVNGLGDVRWGSIGAIARRSFRTRRDGDVLTVQMHSRDVIVDIPLDTSVLRVMAPNGWDDQADRRLLLDGREVAMTRCPGGWVSAAIAVPAGRRAQLALISDQARQSVSTGARRLAPWPALRRALVEGRDRTQPLSRRIAHPTAH